MNYPQLQNKIKRDPVSYAEDFQQQLLHYQSLLAILAMQPEADAADLRVLLNFLSHVSHCYKRQMAAFPAELLDVLQKYAGVLHAEMRKCIVACLFMLKNKGIIDSPALFPHLFALFKCQDKDLRESVYNFVLNDVKNNRNAAQSKALQNLFFCVVEKSDSPVVVRHVLRILIALFKKGIWAEARTVNVVSKCCFAKDIKSAVVALNFFTAAGSSTTASTADEDAIDSEEDDEDYEKKYKDLLKNNQIAGKRKSKHAKMKRALDKIKRRDRREKTESRHFFAIEMLNDPQDFAERLFGVLRNTNERFKIKLLLLNVLSTLIAVHRLVLPDVYSFVTRYLSPHQRDVTLILAYTTQALHEHVSAADASVVIRAVSNAFIADHCANEAIVVGLNTVREMCRRTPHAIDATLLQDLALYKASKDKGVSMAARALIALFRVVNPALLHKRDRGKEGNVAFREQRLATRKAPFSTDKSLNHEDVVISEEESDEEDLEQGDSEIEEWSSEECISDEEDNGTDAISDSCVEIEKEAVEKDCNLPEPRQKRPLLAEKLPSQPSKKQKSLAIESSTNTASLSSSESGSESEEVDERDILGLVRPELLTYQHAKKKASYKERMATIAEGRTDRLKYGSRKGDENRGSKTNKEKSKKKNFMMMVHKRDVKLKSKRSLKEKQVHLQKSRKKHKYNN